MKFLTPEASSERRQGGLEAGEAELASVERESKVKAELCNGFSLYLTG